MNIAYIANIRFPTEKAHGYQIARVASALVESGDIVTLYVPRRRNHLGTDWAAYYGVPSHFKVVRVPCIDFMMGNSVVDTLAFVVQMVTFGGSPTVNIPPGAVVVTDGQSRLTPGAKVEIKAPAANPAAVAPGSEK